MIVNGREPKNMVKAVERILNGDVVAFPTETVYGLGADASNADAVSKIFKTKGRPFEDPLIVHVASKKQLERVAKPLPAEAVAMAEKLMQRFWPGPLTLLFKKKSSVPDVVTGGLETVAVRMPRNLIALALIQNCDRPIAAPSANRFQSLSPTTAEAVEKELGKEVLILDGGPCDVGVESTVLSLLEDEPVVLRPGGVTLEDLAAVLGKTPKVAGPAKGERKTGKRTLMSPGMMDFHYAPGKPLKLVDVEELEALLTKRKVTASNTALLCFSRQQRNKFSKRPFKLVKVLSPAGKLDEAAKQLFKMLREIDESDVKRIVVLKCPDIKVGVALNDRLKKAEHE